MKFQAVKKHLTFEIDNLQRYFVGWFQFRSKTMEIELIARR